MKQAELLTADMTRDNKSLVLSLDDGQELGDKFKNVKVKWEAHTETIPGGIGPLKSGVMCSASTGDIEILSWRNT